MVPMTGRNDPCPCGSGKKYKVCCGRPAASGSAGPAGRVQTFVTPEVRRRAAGVTTWQADVVPVPVRFRDDPSARPGAVMVMAGDMILASEVTVRAPAEAVDLAALLAAAVRSSVQAMERAPGVVEVRHAEVAYELTGMLVADGIRVARRPRLADIDEAASAMALHLSGAERTGPISSPEMWAGWGLPADGVTALFQAAAAFWRAAPWVRLPNDALLVAQFPDGRVWAASVLGRAGQEFGLSLYENAEDFLGILASPPGDEATLDTFSSFTGCVYCLTFDSLHQLERPMQREIASAGWEVAAPEAYPVLMAIGTPGGGVRQRDAADLTAVLGGVAEFAERFGEQLGRGERVEWVDPDTGVLLLHEESEEDLVVSLWDPPSRLAPGGPEGPGACAEAALTVLAAEEDLEASLDEAESTAARFEEWLAARGLSATTVRKHGDNAAKFLKYLAVWTRIPLAALTEYDLRDFLYEWYPRKVVDASYRAKAMPTSLGKFFRWLEAEEGIVCPWARPVLGERQAYTARHVELPGYFFWDPAVQQWQAELSEDLDARVMLHDPSLGAFSQWGAEGPAGWVMGIVEDDLSHELQRRWLIWRDEEIRAGIGDRDHVRAALVRRQREWETTVHPRLEGRTPVEAIEAEREAGGSGG